MKQTLLLILAILLVSCNTHKPNEIELIAYTWSLPDKTHEYTIKTRLYAQINEDGNCILNIKNYGKKNRFISFNIRKETLGSVFELINTAKSDSAIYDNSFVRIYDGPTIKIIGNNRFGKQIALEFIHSDDSNLNCMKLYNYIDSISQKFTNDSNIDTIKILQAKEKLVKEIYKKDILSLPPYDNDTSFHFIAPVIKKQK